jgi:hypothetical protein
MDNSQTIVTNLKEFALTTGWAFGSTTDTQYLPASWGAIGDRVPEVVFDPNVPRYPYSDLFPESPLLSDTERIFNLYTDPVDEDIPGWLSAFDPYWADIGVTPPDGALYGYTLIPESLLDKAWPCNDVEIDFAKVKLLANGIPIDNTFYTVTNEGIWWTQSGYEYSPLNTVVGDDKNYTIELFTQIQSAEPGNVGVDESQSAFSIGSSELELDIERLGGGCQHVAQNIRFFQNQTTNLELPVTDRNGQTIVLDETKHYVTLVLRQGTENTIISHIVPTLSEDGTKVSLPITVEDAGVYKAQLLVASLASDELLHVGNYYLVVEPVGALSNMVTIEDIRMNLMDNCPDENKLILAYELKDTDITAAMRRCVDYFNGAGFVKCNATVGSMPTSSRYFFIQGVSAQLLRSAAFKFARNELPYSAGGVSVNDQAKYAQYMKMSEILDQEWKMYVAETKHAMNVRNAFFMA